MFLSHMALAVQAGIALELVIALLCFFGLIGLRFLRRGAARFGVAPAATALVLLPLAIGAVVTALAFQQALDGLALTGSGGIAAIAAGAAESLVPLILGLVCAAGLAFCGLLATTVGSSRSKEGALGGGLVMPLGSLVMVVLAAGLVAMILVLVGSVIAELPHPQTILARSRASLIGAAGLTLVLFVLALVAALRAPRGVSGFGVKLVSLSPLLLSGLGALVGLWVAFDHMQCLSSTALTGVPCDALPAVATAPAAEALPLPPPPPPPPPRRSQQERSAPAEAARDTTARGVDGGVRGGVPGGVVRGAPGGEAVRVGGQIKEPKKLSHVNPTYPEIAKQARVQGIVILECTISPQGRIASVKVLRGIPLLDGAAIDAVKQWVYAPTLLNGVPVPVIMTVTVNFRLS